MKTERQYKGFKLITYKESRGRYVTYVFDGGLKAIAKYNYRLKRDSIELAQIACDYNEFAGGAL